MLGGVHYYTGYVLDMEKIARVCNECGVMVGFDLAHAVGNVKLELTKWNVDFAVWCSYKYLNSGPGGMAGVFVHNKHHHDASIPRFEGWWGSDRATRFEMLPKFTPMPGAWAWQLSNPPVMEMISLRGSMEVFDLVPDLNVMFEKSRVLTQFLYDCLVELLPAKSWHCLTPPYPRRGCQLSIAFTRPIVGKVYEDLIERGFICDKREPDVLRFAPAPLFNTFTEVYQFATAVGQAVRKFDSNSTGLSAASRM
jgi:kynureninase